MATLKGKNLRVLIHNDASGSSDTWNVVGMSTNCSVQYTNNTENANHKDIVGIAQVPTVVSQACTISVESLSVTDAAVILAAIKSGQPMLLCWDETSTTNNQTALGATFARKGLFYMNDVNFQFDNRTNATKSVQFSSTGKVEALTEAPNVEVTTPGSLTKGQNIRLYLSSDNTAAPSKVIASARTLQLHVSLSLEDATTKDTDDNWVVQEPTELTWDITTSALVRSNDTITSQVLGQDLAAIEAIKEDGLPVKGKIANASGDNNRTAGLPIISGSLLITQLTLNSPLESASYETQLTGVGNYTVGA